MSSLAFEPKVIFLQNLKPGQIPTTFCEIPENIHEGQTYLIHEVTRTTPTGASITTLVQDLISPSQRATLTAWSGEGHPTFRDVKEGTILRLGYSSELYQVEKFEFVKRKGGKKSMCQVSGRSLKDGKAVEEVAPVFDLLRLPNSKALEEGLEKAVPRVTEKPIDRAKGLPIRGGRKG